MSQNLDDLFWGYLMCGYLHSNTRQRQLKYLVKIFTMKSQDKLLLIVLIYLKFGFYS